VATFGALLWLEHRHPLRRRVLPQAPRVARNLAIGALGAASVAAVEGPLATRAARLTEERELGIVPRLVQSRVARRALALLLLDYTLYAWHVLLHRVPLLWKAHQVHHADFDLDVSTAARFHAAELLMSVPWRLVQIVLIGVPRTTLRLWGTLTLASVMFHHSNLRLPAGFERWLRLAIVTPRMHGIHHSMRRDERNSNFSSGLALWDALHGTGRHDVPQDAITIGLADHREEAQVTLSASLREPFQRTSSE
jgi:sterol desaturase/sphingolipid hydroxylase (fatty acid hydroxylase superfamily)